MRARSKGLLLAALSTVAALLLAEAILSMFAPVSFRRPPRSGQDAVWRELLHRPSSLPGLPYELRPGARGRARGADVSINELGMRDESPRPLAPSRLRVAVLGDSFTFGFGVKVNEAFPARMESLLAHEPQLEACDVDVLNFGVSGYNTLDEAALLRGRVASLKPDAIVVGYVLNDPQLEPIQPLQTHFAPVHWWQRWNLLRLAARARMAFDQKRYGGGDFFLYLHEPDAGFWPQVEEAFGRIASVASDLQVPALLVIFPIPPDQTWETYAYGGLHAQVTAAARARGLRVLDLLPAFSRVEPTKLRLDAQDEHPTPLAHEIAAQLLVAKLRPDLVAACRRGP